MSTPNLVNEPILIVGSLRSGTTLFRLMLDRHPQINIFGEFEEAVSRLGDDGWVNLDYYVSWLKTRRIFTARKYEIRNFTHYPDLIRDFMRQMYARSNKPFIGALIHSRFDRCPDIFPGARYIHVLRDPRDVARSCIGMGWVGNVYYGANYWIEAERRWDRLSARTAPAKRTEIRYEELVADPVSVLTQVCEFLGVDFDTQMLSYHLDSTYSPPNPSLAKQWKSKLSDREIRHVEYQCGDLMEARGYTKSHTVEYTPSPAERTYLYIQNRYKRAQASVKQYGVKMWLLSRLTNYIDLGDASIRIKRRMNEIEESSLK